MKKITMTCVLMLFLTFTSGTTRIYNASNKPIGHIKTQGNLTTVYDESYRPKYKIKVEGNMIKVYDASWRLIKILKKE